MKTKLYLPIISLLAMSVFAFISCDDSDSDTTKPVIELSEPEEGQELKIGDEHGVHFEMDLSDDVMLKSYMIEIHRQATGTDSNIHTIVGIFILYGRKQSRITGTTMFRPCFQT